MVPSLPAEEGSDETTHERVLEGLRSARANGLSNLLLVLVVVMLLQLFIIAAASEDTVVAALKMIREWEREGKVNLSFHLRAFSLSRSTVVSAQTGIPTQKIPAEPLGGRRPAETQADSLSTRALC